jgi:hypothetical protein
VFFSLQFFFSFYETQQLILRTGTAIWWVTEPHCAECHYDECHYADCCYPECHYAECRGASVPCLFNQILENLYSTLQKFNDSDVQTFVSSK